MHSELLLDRARGALLGTFVGDALGMPFEGQHGRLVPPRLEMLDARLGRGTYSDDTQRMPDAEARLDLQTCRRGRVP